MKFHTPSILVAVYFFSSHQNLIFNRHWVNKDLVEGSGHILGGIVEYGLVGFFAIAFMGYVNFSVVLCSFVIFLDGLWVEVLLGHVQLIYKYILLNSKQIHILNIIGLHWNSWLHGQDSTREYLCRKQTIPYLLCFL